MQVGLHKTYYAASVSHDEAVALLNYLTQEGFFVSDDEANMHLGKNGSTYELRFIIKTGLENDPETVTQMQQLGALLSADVFGGSLVDIHLCDQDLKTLRVLVIP